MQRLRGRFSSNLLGFMGVELVKIVLREVPEIMFREIAKIVHEMGNLSVKNVGIYLDFRWCALHEMLQI